MSGKILIRVIHFLTDDDALTQDDFYCNTNISLKYKINYIATREAVKIPNTAKATLVYCSNTTYRIFEMIKQTLQGIRNATIKTKNPTKNPIIIFCSFIIKKIIYG